MISFELPNSKDSFSQFAESVCVLPVVPVACTSPSRFRKDLSAIPRFQAVICEGNPANMSSK